MKTTKEIEQLAEKLYTNVDGYLELIEEAKMHFVIGYTQCQEDTAIGFAEWCADNLWIFKVYDNIWINYGGVDLRKLKSSELFSEYKKLNKQD